MDRGRHLRADQPVLTAIPRDISPLKARLFAAGLHLVLSLLIFVSLFGIIVNLWFPEPYFTASGGVQGLKIVTLVDLVLGPLLTLIVFNRRKPTSELARDLGIIVMLQLAALAWGIHTVYQQRPLAIVFWDNAFYTVPASTLQDTSSSEEVAVLRKMPRQLHIVPRPNTAEDYRPILEAIENESIPPFHKAEWYQALPPNMEEIERNQVEIDEIIQSNPEMAAQLDKLLAETGLTRDKLVFSTLFSKFHNVILILSPNGTLVGYLKAPYSR